MKQISYLMLVIICLFGCSTKDQVIDAEVAESSLHHHIKILASDDFEGRKPFTEGETKTINYIKEQFEALGLEPGNGDSYFQEVPLVELTAIPTPTMTISGGAEDLVLNVSEDFVAYTERVTESVNLDASELVFAGHGTVAPEYGWNDYEELDVKGKTVVVLVNDPGFKSGDSTFFKGKTMTYYGRWTYKYEEAARQGAAGCLIIHSTEPAGYGWTVVSNSWSGASLYLESGDGYQPDVLGWITEGAAEKVFMASGLDMENYSNKARSRDFKSHSLGLIASVGVTNRIKRSTSQNVVGRIIGSESPDETIIYTGHWDHLGIGNVVDGDSIYNGAIDNASGIAAMLGIAEAFKKLDQPKRSIIFLAVTAEEQGLLGSKYYAENPIYEVKKSVCNINMDALGNIGKMKDLTVVGFGQSEMEDIAGKLATKQGRYIVPDSHPGKGYFFRSDHFHFAKIGIPALYAKGSTEHLEKGVQYAEQKNREYRENAYHGPADEYSEDIDLGGARQDAQLFFEIGWRLSNSEEWPKWKEGSEFKAIREGE
ncbi:MAG: M28 family peptidase [Cytophagales bacterium]|nr:M28 family peptidase [Cytophagales bacterium]